MIKKIFPYIIAFYAFLYRPKRREYFMEVIEKVSVKHDWMSDELYKRYREIIAKQIDELHEKTLEELRHSVDMDFFGLFEKTDALKKHE